MSVYPGFFHNGDQTQQSNNNNNGNVVQGQVIDSSSVNNNASYGYPVADNNGGWNNNNGSDFPPYYGQNPNPAFPSASQFQGQPNAVVIVQVGHDGNGYYLPNNNQNPGGHRPSNFTDAEQDDLYETMRNANWVKIYFVVAAVIIFLNAIFSGLWFVLAALAATAVAYVGLRLWNYNIMAVGCFYWFAVIALRILSIVTVFTWESDKNDTVDRILACGFGAVGIGIDLYFAYKYTAIMSSIKKMTEAQIEELKLHAPQTCGCL